MAARIEAMRRSEWRLLASVSHELRTPIARLRYRLAMLEEGVAEATFLASAGLTRLGYTAHIRDYIAPEVMLPAVAQGAVGIECRSARADMVERIARMAQTASGAAGNAAQAADSLEKLASQQRDTLGHYTV